MREQRSSKELGARQQIRDFAHQLDATSYILRRLNFPVHKLRDVVDGLQGAAGGREEFELSFLALARRLRHAGKDMTAQTYMQRKVRLLDEAQRKAGRMLFTITRGGGFEHKRTRYIDHLTPAANWLMRQARESNLWATHPGRAIESFVDDAIQRLPLVFVGGIEGHGHMPIEDNEYIQRMVNQGINYALKGCDRAAEIGVDDIGVARMAAEKLLRYAEDRHRSRSAIGVNIRTPSREAGNAGRHTELYPFEEKSQEKADVLAAALDYSRSGIPIFPARTNKTPYTARGFKEATTDEKTICAWWQKHPDAGIGVPTGETSGWLVIDSDPRHGGDVSLCALFEQHGELPETLEAETGGGGHHIIFQYPKGSNIRNSAGKLGEGLDVRAEGGYAIVAPSLHGSGRRYRWRNENAPAPAPDWLLELLAVGQEISTMPSAKTRSQVESSMENVDLIGEGSRNDTLFKIGCSMRGKGADFAEIEAELSKINAHRCLPPLPESEVQKIAHSAANYAANRVAVGA